MIKEIIDARILHRVDAEDLEADRASSEILVSVGPRRTERDVEATCHWPESPSRASPDRAGAHSRRPISRG
jgi:hypothetical protein